MENLSEETLLELKTLFDSVSKPFNGGGNGGVGPDGDDCAQNSGDGNEDQTIAQFMKIQNRLDEILSEVTAESDVYYKLIAMKHSLMYEEAKVHLSRNEIETAHELLEKALDGISGIKHHPQIAFLYIRIVNHLAYLLTKRGDFEKPRFLLEDVTQSVRDDFIVYSSEELFSNRECDDEMQALSRLGKLMASNFQMLGWVYSKLGNYDMYTTKLHEALQILLNVYDNDLVQWCRRCIRLALLFLNKCQYIAARYHLSATATVLSTIEPEMSQHSEFGKVQADLARTWMHYSLHLFGISKKVILERMCNESELYYEEERIHVDPEVVSRTLTFADLDVVIENVPAMLIKTTAQARALFNFAQMWLKRVRVYYNIRDYPILYVNTVLNESELYRFLASYEPDLESQYNVQRSRSDCLERMSTILKEVRPESYLAVSVELTRELAEVQVELMSLNLRKLYAGEMDRSENAVKRRMQALSDIHTKLEDVSGMLDQEDLTEDEEEEDEVEDIIENDERIDEEVQ